ncbi:hypothetical protein [Mangrovitalea sediminis]|nr:hypothetical protein [Mangrovitalea sediminis]
MSQPVDLYLYFKFRSVYRDLAGRRLFPSLDGIRVNRCWHPVTRL